MATLSSNELRKGIVFADQGETYIVLKYDHVTQGRGGTTVKVKVKNLRSKSITTRSYKGNETVESVSIEHLNAQFIYRTDNIYHFMGLDNFEQFELNMEENPFLKEGDKVVMILLNGDPIDIDLPNIVELKVDYTEDGIRGNTSGNALKKARLETGFELMVPLFINIGDIVKVNTESYEYVGRK